MLYSKFKFFFVIYVINHKNPSVALKVNGKWATTIYVHFFNVNIALDWSPHISSIIRTDHTLILMLLNFIYAFKLNNNLTFNFICMEVYVCIVYTIRYDRTQFSFCLKMFHRNHFIVGICIFHQMKWNSLPW